MEGKDIVTNKIDTKKDSKIDTTELLANISKLNDNEYKDVANNISFNVKEVITLIEPAIFDVVEKNNLLDKKQLSVNEIKIMKLFFMTVDHESFYKATSELDVNGVGFKNFYGWGDVWWGNFKQGIKWWMMNELSSVGASYYSTKEIGWPISPGDVLWLNSELLSSPIQMSNKIQQQSANITKSQEDINKLEIKTRILSKKLKDIDDRKAYTFDDLQDLVGASDGVLFKDEITTMTYNEQQKIIAIFGKVINNSANNIDETMDYVRRFVYILSDEKWSNEKGNSTSELAQYLNVGDQSVLRVECINSIYAKAQEKYFKQMNTDVGGAKENLYKLCQIMTGQYTKDQWLTKKDQYQKFLNYTWAENILISMMYINDTLSKVLKTTKANVLWDNSDLSGKTPNDVFTEFCKQVPSEMFINLWFWALLDTKYLYMKWSDLPPLLQSQMVVLKKIIAETKVYNTSHPNINRSSKIYVDNIIKVWTEASKKQWKVLELLFNTNASENVDFIKWVSRWSDYWLKWVDEKIFDLYLRGYTDNFWAWLSSFKTDEKLEWYAKMWAMVLGTVMITMIFPPAGVGYAWSALAIGIWSTMLQQALYTKFKYDNAREGIKDISSQLVINTATAFVSMKFFGPIIQETPWFLNNVGNITKNLGMATIDFSIWTLAEAGRQTVIWQESDFAAMVTTWWIMAAIFLVVGWGLHVKSPELHYKNQLKVAEEGIAYLDVATNKTKFIAEYGEAKYTEAYALLKKQKSYLEWEIVKINTTSKPKTEETTTGNKKKTENIENGPNKTEPEKQKVSESEIKGKLHDELKDATDITKAKEILSKNKKLLEDNIEKIDSTVKDNPIKKAETVERILSESLWNSELSLTIKMDIKAEWSLKELNDVSLKDAWWIKGKYNQWLEDIVNVQEEMALNTRLWERLGQENSDIKSKISSESKLTVAEKRIIVEMRQNIKDSVEFKDGAWKEKFKTTEKYKTSKDDYTYRFQETLKIWDPSMQLLKVKSVDGIVKKISIKEYQEDLFTIKNKDIDGNIVKNNLAETPEGKALRNEIQKYGFEQSLDNPMEFCSHGFDHTINVDMFAKNLSELELKDANWNTTNLKGLTKEKYGLTNEWSAELLLRMSAVFHDFGYPMQSKLWLEKSMHAPLWGGIFKSEFCNTSTGKDSFIKFREKQLPAWANTNKIVQDMYESIFYHGADKVEKWFLNQISFTKGTFLINDIDKSTTALNQFLKIVHKNAWEDIEISYRTWNTKAKENAEKLVDFLVSKWFKAEAKEYLWGKTDYDTDMYSGDNPDKNLFLWRKADKEKNLGIEYKKADVSDNPLLWVVRYADNFDAMIERLSAVQSHPLTTDRLYNAGYVKQSAEWSYAKLYNRFERYNDMPAEMSKLNNRKGELERKIADVSTTPTDKIDAQNQLQSVVKDIQDKNIEWSALKTDIDKMKIDWVKYTIYKFENGNIVKDAAWNEVKKEITISANDFNRMIITWKIDINTYKNMLLENLTTAFDAQYYKFTPADKSMQDAIKMMIEKKDVGPYSFRHFAGLLPIRDVTIWPADNMAVVNGNKKIVIKVTVDERLYKETVLAKETVKEDNATTSISQYHIFRIFSATKEALTINGENLDLHVYNQQWRLLQKTDYVRSGKQKFELYDEPPFTFAP